MDSLNGELGLHGRSRSSCSVVLVETLHKIILLWPRNLLRRSTESAKDTGIPAQGSSGRLAEPLQESGGARAGEFRVCTRIEIVRQGQLGES